MHQSWRSTQAKLLQKKNGLWANRQALSIKHYKFGYQCAFACWDAAISHKTKQEEARTSDKANGLSLFHEGYSGWAAQLHATHSIPLDLTPSTLLNTYFTSNLAGAKLFRGNEQLWGACSGCSCTQSLLHTAACLWERPWRDEGGPYHAGGGWWARTCHGAVVSSCVDIPDPPRPCFRLCWGFPVESWGGQDGSEPSPRHPVSSIKVSSKAQQASREVVCFCHSLTSRSKDNFI